MSEDTVHAALTTALRRLQSVVEDDSPLAAAAALEAASGAASALSHYDRAGLRRAARDELLALMQRAAALMRSLTAR
jgi:hypothetical protein